MDTMLRTCDHRFGNGRLCQGMAVHGEQFCRHHLRYQDKRDITSPDYVMPDIEDGDSIQLLVNETLRGLVSGKMDPKQGRSILWGALIASSNLKRGQLSRFEEARARVQGAGKLYLVRYLCEPSVATAIEKMRSYIIGSGPEAGRTIGELFDILVANADAARESGNSEQHSG